MLVLTSLLDMALASHVVGAPLVDVSLDKTPMLEAVTCRCLEMDTFAQVHRLAQPGAPESLS